MISTTQPGITPAPTGRKLAVTEALSHLPDLVSCGPGRAAQTSYSPLDGSLVGAVPVCTPDDVAAAVESARAAQREWAAVPLRERRAVVARFHALLLHREAEILDLVQAESGKSRLNAFEELADAALTAAYYRRTAERFLRSRRRTGAAPGLTRTVEYRIPKGVVGIISPWNYPLTLAVSDAIPALLAGNACVLKPDSQTPFTALLALELLREAGLPRDLFQIVTGDGPTLGPALISGVDFLMFTGSSETGRIVAQQCAERLIGFSGELGGKNATLVLADADLDKAARGAAQGCFSNSGQLCISMERIYVHRAVFDDFLATFTEHVEAIRLGAGPGWDIDMGSLTGQRQLDRVSAHVEDARAKGARVLPLHEQGQQRRMPPHVLLEVNDDMQVMQDEIFGPLLPVVPYDGIDQALAYVNARPRPLALYYFGYDKTEQRRVLRHTHSGGVCLNDTLLHVAQDDLPFGGIGPSGMGHYHGHDGFLTFSKAKGVFVKQRFNAARLIYPPYGKTLQKLVYMLFVR